MNARSKMTAVPKLSYLHFSKLKKCNRNRQKLFYFLNLVLLIKGFYFSSTKINDKKISDIKTLKYKSNTFPSIAKVSTFLIYSRETEIFVKYSMRSHFYESNESVSHESSYESVSGFRLRLGLGLCLGFRWGLGLS